jgi:hypothetical protein
MKIKWSTAIVIAMISFIVFILSFVYKSVMMDEYQHELVSEDYYRDELHYQEEIDKLKKASELKEDVSLVRNNEGLTIRFPEDLDASQITGTIYLQRPSNQNLDLRMQIELRDNEILIPDESLATGKYLVIVDWKHEASEYMFKDEIFY